MNDQNGSKLGKLPLYAVVILLCLLWVTPTVGLLVTSLRPRQDVVESGWWRVFASREAVGQETYEQYCASCHGASGAEVAEADLSAPALVEQYRRSVALTAVLREPLEDGTPHVAEMPDAQQTADILTYMRQLSGAESAATRPRLTVNNYVDAVVGYSGRASYVESCVEGDPAEDDACLGTGLTSERGMATAFLNSLWVTIPATILPILFASFAAYAFSWLDFKGRQWMFITLVALQIVPLQMTLIPIYRIYAQVGLTGTFLGVWLFHTGFGLPYAIYLMRNFLGALPKDLFESAYLDGASHWTAFYKLALPLSVPALASLGIFQFLWIWNDLLVALVFLGGQTPVLTWQISNLVGRFTGMHLLTAAAFVSMILPMVVFFGMQRFFVRGLMAGAVKG
ncbi:MAG: ABC transporter permease subunit [Chloroflexota bacterium]|nr:ABC transporter permease subunit [Chloroflexota bacterium]